MSVVESTSPFSFSYTYSSKSANSNPFLKENQCIPLTIVGESLRRNFAGSFVGSHWPQHSPEIWECASSSFGHFILHTRRNCNGKVRAGLAASRSAARRAHYCRGASPPARRLCHPRKSLLTLDLCPAAGPVHPRTQAVSVLKRAGEINPTCYYSCIAKKCGTKGLQCEVQNSSLCGSTCTSSSSSSDNGPAAHPQLSSSNNVNQVCYSDCIAKKCPTNGATCRSRNGPTCTSICSQSSGPADEEDDEP